MEGGHACRVLDSMRHYFQCAVQLGHSAYRLEAGLYRRSTVLQHLAEQKGGEAVARADEGYPGFQLCTHTGNS